MHRKAAAGAGIELERNPDFRPLVEKRAFQPFIKFVACICLHGPDNIFRIIPGPAILPGRQQNNKPGVPAGHVFKVFCQAFLFKHIGMPRQKLDNAGIFTNFILRPIAPGQKDAAFDAALIHNSAMDQMQLVVQLTNFSKDYKKHDCRFTCLPVQMSFLPGVLKKIIHLQPFQTINECKGEQG